LAGQPLEDRSVVVHLAADPQKEGSLLVVRLPVVETLAVKARRVVGLLLVEALVAAAAGQVVVEAVGLVEALGQTLVEAQRLAELLELQQA